MEPKELIDKIHEPQDLLCILKEAKCDSQECDNNKTFIHNRCIEFKQLSDQNCNTHGDNNDANQRKINLLPIPHCQDALVYIIIEVIAQSPKLIDDDAKQNFAHYYKTNNVEARRLVLPEYLSLLSTANSQLLAWLKYETLLIHLIKEQIYAPKTFANEILAIVKNELKPNIAAKFSSVVSACVKYCREANKGKNEDEEEEEKWCEIIDWMSWFMSTDDDGLS